MTDPTLKGLVNHCEEFLEAQLKVILSLDGFAREQVLGAFVKTLKDENSREAIRINGLRPSDQPDTGRAAWMIARNNLIKKYGGGQ